MSRSACRAGFPAPAASAQGANYTITLTGTNLAGQPTGDAVFLVNVDNSSITGNPRDTGSAFYQGSTTFSGPSGHYFAIADFVDTSSDGTVTGERVVTVPQFTVSGNKTVHLDERTADSEISFATPRPATLQATEYEVVRTPVNRPAISFGFLDQQPTSAWVARTSTPVTTGALTTYADGWLTSPASAAAAPYQYNLAYQGPPVIPPASTPWRRRRWRPCTRGTSPPCRSAPTWSARARSPTRPPPFPRTSSASSSWRRSSRSACRRTGPSTSPPARHCCGTPC